MAGGTSASDHYRKVLVLYLEVLVLYLERPPRDSGQLHGPGGALLIQRLEGSRPHGSLCTFNRSERVQRNQEETELGRVRWREAWMEQESGLARADEKAGGAGIGWVLAG
jgi:hypothetical protein